MPAARAANQGAHVAGQLLVRFEAQVPRERVAAILAEQEAVSLRAYPDGRLFLVKLADEADIARKAAAFMNYDEVEYAEPNQIYSVEGRK